MEIGEKLVVDFMGCTVLNVYNKSFTYKHPTKTKWVWSNQFKDNIETDIFSKTLDPFYSDDWNLLMELVDKIESLNGGQFQVNILQEGCFIQRYCNEVISDKRVMKVNPDTTKIESVYLACVEFIKYWNKIKF